MKDKWMNIGYEGEELQPYHEPDADLNDDIRIRKQYTTLSFVLHVLAGCDCTSASYSYGNKIHVHVYHTSVLQGGIAHVAIDIII